ncbi:hypothetical protein [Oenococcus phage fOg44]|nr:hypothetical protein [Oenococcus phage fOg44]
MAITMCQADRNFVSPADDASLYDALAQYQSRIINRGNKFNITIDGLVATINTGQAIIQGRLVKVTEPEQITLPANASGNINIVIDLTQTNTVSGNHGDSDYAVSVNQVYLAAVTGTSTQEDLNNGGFIYNFPLASFTSTTTSANITSTHTLLDTGWVDLAPSAGQLSTTGTPGKLAYRLINNLFWLNCNGLLEVKQGATLFKIPTSYAPAYYMNCSVVVRQENSSNGGSGVG